VARCLYTAVAAGRDDHAFQGLRDEDYAAGDTLNVGSETWRVDTVEDTGVTQRIGDRKDALFSRTLHCTVVK
jgi:hypothetical protein